MFSSDWFGGSIDVRVVNPGSLPSGSRSDTPSVHVGIYRVPLTGSNLGSGVDQEPKMKNQKRQRHYVAATLFAFLAVAGFFWIGATRNQSPDRVGQDEVRVEVEEKIAFSERAEIRLDQMKQELDAVSPTSSEGELAMEIEALSNEIQDLDNELERVDDALSPSEKERMETTLINLERRVQTLNTPVSLLEIEPIAP